MKGKYLLKGIEIGIRELVFYGAKQALLRKTHDAPR